MNISTFVNSPFEGTVRLADGVLKNILAIHSNGIISGKPGNFLGRRIEVCYAPFMIRGKQTIRNAIHDLDKAFLFLVQVLEGLGIVFMDLIRNKIAPPAGVDLALFLEIGTGQAGGQLLKKIFLDKVGAVGL